MLPASAFAANAPCTLRVSVKSCEDNLQIANEGKACLKSYDAAILVAQAKVAKSLESVAAADQQSVGLENAKKSYALAIGALKDLVKEGEARRLQVEAYKNQVALPDDFVTTTEAGLPAEEFLRNQPCYTETQKLIQRHARNIGLSARQLSLTAEISEELAKKAFRGESSLKNKDLLPLIQPKSAAGGAAKAAPKDPPKDKSGKSDITGTVKKKP